MKIKKTQQGRCLLPSNEDVNVSSFRNVAFSGFFELSDFAAKSKNPIILSVIHHCQNHLESISNILYYILYIFYLSAFYFLLSYASSSSFHCSELLNQQNTTTALTDPSWHCCFLLHAQCVVTYSSTYVLVALSIDRYDAVTHPMNFSGSCKSVSKHIFRSGRYRQCKSSGQCKCYVYISKQVNIMLHILYTVCTPRISSVSSLYCHYMFRSSWAIIRWLK
jgi:hypothetical protein